MCAAGPPNAVQPMSTNEKKMSLYVAWTSCEGGGKGVEGAGDVSHMRGAVTADRRARRCIARTLGFSSADSGSTGLSVALTGVTIATSRVWRASALAADQGHSFYSFTRHRRQLVNSHRLISHDFL